MISFRVTLWLLLIHTSFSLGWLNIASTKWCITILWKNSPSDSEYTDSKFICPGGDWAIQKLGNYDEGPTQITIFAGFLPDKKVQFFKPKWRQDYDLAPNDKEVRIEFREDYCLWLMTLLGPSFLGCAQACYMGDALQNPYYYENYPHEDGIPINYVEPTHKERYPAAIFMDSDYWHPEKFKDTCDPIMPPGTRAKTAPSSSDPGQTTSENSIAEPDETAPLADSGLLDLSLPIFKRRHPRGRWDTRGERALGSLRPASKPPKPDPNT